MAKRPISTHVNVADIEKKLIEPFKGAAEQIRKAERRAIRESLTSTRGVGRKKAAEEYAIKPSGKKKLFAKIRQMRKSNTVETGELAFSGAVGTEFHHFPALPAKTPANWLRRGFRSGVNPKLRQPKEGVRLRIFKGGGYKVKLPRDARGRFVRGPKGKLAKTFWIKLEGRRKRDGADIWVLAYRIRNARWVNGKRIPGGLTRKGLYAASMIQAIARQDILTQLSIHATERFRVRLTHNLNIYLKGILK